MGCRGGTGRDLGLDMVGAFSSPPLPSHVGRWHYHSGSMPRGGHVTLPGHLGPIRTISTTALLGVGPGRLDPEESLWGHGDRRGGGLPEGSSASPTCGSKV